MFLWLLVSHNMSWKVTFVTFRKAIGGSTIVYDLMKTNRRIN